MSTHAALRMQASPIQASPLFTPWPCDLAERYRRDGLWRGETLGTVLSRRARELGDHTALVCGARRIGYDELDERARRVTLALWELGLRPRDRVVVQLPNVAELVVVCFALFRLGAIPVLALPAHRSAEIGAFCEITEAVAYVSPERFGGFDYHEITRAVLPRAPHLRHVLTVRDVERWASQPPPRDLELPEPDASDVALFQLSGGSTGTPKLIPRTHDDYLYSVRASAELCELGRDSVYLATLPAGHNFPLSSPGVLGTLWAGGRVVMCPYPSPDEAFAWIERERVTITGVVPPLALAWLEAAEARRHDLSSLRVLQVGGAKLAIDLARRVRPVLGCKLQQVFGMAEGLVCYTRLDEPEEVVVATQGRPLSPADEIRIVDDDDDDVAPGEVGHLLTRGPYTIRGYYEADDHNARAFTADGFYRTGDLVRRTARGHLVVEGRAKDQINRGGEKIAAEEIEIHLRSHPAVHDAAVVAVPDAYLGERACAFVVPREPALRPAELVAFLRGRGLAAFKVPDRIHFVNVLPTTSVGKIDKRTLARVATNPTQDTTPDTSHETTRP